MADSLTVAVASTGTIPTVRLKGSLAYGENLAPIHEAVVRLKREGHDRLVLDLSAVEKIDSSGLSALLDAKQTLGPQSRVFLLGPSERIRAALAMVRVTSLFEFVDDEAGLT
jgi:anti-anti-sigma factor